MYCVRVCIPEFGEADFTESLLLRSHFKRIVCLGEQNNVACHYERFLLDLFEANADTVTNYLRESTLIVFQRFLVRTFRFQCTKMKI